MTAAFTEVLFGFDNFETHAPTWSAAYAVQLDTCLNKVFIWTLTLSVNHLGLGPMSITWN